MDITKLWMMSKARIAAIYNLALRAAILDILFYIRFEVHFQPFRVTKNDIIALISLLFYNRLQFRKEVVE
jgi:hypothetical protein